MSSQDIIRLLSKARFSLTDEKACQLEIAATLASSKVDFIREHELDKTSKPDFMIDGIAIEVKIKGSPSKIYRQLARYAGFESVREIILITNRSMGMPPQIKSKPCYVLNMGRAWL